MTLSDFLHALPVAARSTDCRPMTGGLYAPAGLWVRFLLPPGAAVRHPAIPPVVDPLGLVYAAKLGILRGPLESPIVGRELGLPADIVGLLILAADEGADNAIRRAYLEVVRSLPADPHLPYL